MSTKQDKVENYKMYYKISVPMCCIPNKLLNVYINKP